MFALQIPSGWDDSDERPLEEATPPSVQPPQPRYGSSDDDDDVDEDINDHNIPGSYEVTMSCD